MSPRTRRLADRVLVQQKVGEADGFVYAAIVSQRLEFLEGRLLAVSPAARVWVRVGIV